MVCRSQTQCPAQGPTEEVSVYMASLWAPSSSDTPPENVLFYVTYILAQR